MNKEVAEYNTEEKILLYLEQLVKEGILIKNYDAYCPETEDYIRTVSFNIEASGKNKCKVVLQKLFVLFST